MGKVKAMHKKISYGGKEIVDVYVKKKIDSRGTSTIFGVSGESEHVTHLISSGGTISAHKTDCDKHQNLFESTETKKAIEMMAKELESKLTKEEYLGDDLILVDKQKLQEFVDEINNESLFDFQKAIEKLVANINVLFKEVSRKDLEQLNDQVLINSKKQQLLLHNGKIYLIDEFQQNPFSGIFGAFFGLNGFDFKKVEEQTKTKLSEK